MEKLQKVKLTVHDRSKTEEMSLRQVIKAVKGELPQPALEQWASVFFSLSVLTLLLSLAASQAFLAVAGVLYAIHLVRHPERPSFPPIKLPLALFCLTTLISIGWAENPTIGWLAVRKFVLFLILLFAVNLIISERHLRFLYKMLFFESALAAVVAAYQFFEQYRKVYTEHPSQIYMYMIYTRITGFMGHWMNFGGQQMLVLTVLMAYLLLGTREESAMGTAPDPTKRQGRVHWIWWLVLLVVALSVFLNLSRGVWLGCMFATVYIVARWRARWLWAIPLLLVIAYSAAPSLVRQRLQLGLHPSREPALSQRLEMWQAGLNMIRQHPWVGVGPNNIPEVYTLYLPRGKSPQLGYHDHLHDDVLQFAAERGLPCMAAWIWLMLALVWHCARIRRRARRLRWIADAAIAAWIALVVEGAFEYGFGGSPVVMMFLFIIATPFAIVCFEGRSTT